VNARTLIPRNVMPLLMAATEILGICMLQSCTNVKSGPSQPPADIGGTWEGSTTAGCFMARGRCNAYRLITMSIVQNGSNLSGSYTCAYGNMVCLGDANAGTIATGRVDGSYLPDLRIQLPDGVDCLYQGHFTGNQGEGGYMCLVGGRMIEQGSWLLKRKT
jgi:hypothetical protein